MVQPRAAQQITYMFCPVKMTKYRATVEIEAIDVPPNVGIDVGSNLSWKYQIEGVPTIISKKTQSYSCPARKQISKILTFQLDHLDEQDRGIQDFSTNLNIP